MSSRKSGGRRGKGGGGGGGSSTSQQPSAMAAKYVTLLKGCRLCGSGGGYRMPIMTTASQHSINHHHHHHHNTTADTPDTELTIKIKDCLNIHVNSNDCMPPLICELCLDKVNDFYEFREMCRSTDQRIRSILGLPPQTVDNNSDDDCILGVSVPIFVGAKSETNLPKKSALKKEKETRKSEKRSKRFRSPSPPLLTQVGTRKRKTVDTPPPPVKKIRFQSPPPVERKSSRHSSPPPSKKKASAATKKEAGPASRKVAGPASKKESGPASKKTAPSPAGSSVGSFACEVCSVNCRTKKLLTDHQKTNHLVNVWSQRLSCSPCNLWFVTQKEADSHHRWHRSSNTYYTCKRCATDFRIVTGYNKHFKSKQCIPEPDIPDPLCSSCNRHFVTENLLKQHQCSGFGPPGVSMVELNPNNPHLQSLRCIEVRMPRCDGLISNIKQEPQDFIDIKTEPDYHGYDDFTAMDNIKHEPGYMGYEDDPMAYGNDDAYSDASDESQHGTIPASNIVRNPFARKNATTVDSLSVISLRSIFASPKLLGRSPKPRRVRVKREAETEKDKEADKSVEESPDPLTNSVQPSEDNSNNDNSEVVKDTSDLVNNSEGAEATLQAPANDDKEAVGDSAQIEQQIESTELPTESSDALKFSDKKPVSDTVESNGFEETSAIVSSADLLVESQAPISEDTRICSTESESISNNIVDSTEDEVPVNETRAPEEPVDETKMPDEPVNGNTVSKEHTNENETSESLINETIVPDIPMNENEVSEVVDETTVPEKTENEPSQELLNKNEVFDKLLNENVLSEDPVKYNEVPEEAVKDNEVSEDVIKGNEVSEDPVKCTEVPEEPVKCNEVLEEPVSENNAPEELVNKNIESKKLINEDIESAQLELEVTNGKPILDHDEQILHDSLANEEICNKMDIDSIMNGDSVITSDEANSTKFSDLNGAVDAEADADMQAAEAMLEGDDFLDDVEMDKSDFIGNEDELLRDESELEADIAMTVIGSDIVEK